MGFDLRPPRLILAPVGHYTRLLRHLCAGTATDYDTDALLRAAHLARKYNALLGRDDDWFWFC